MWASAVSVTCLLRHLPLFFRERPRTPLRVLGIIAFDTLHVLGGSSVVPRRRIDELAWFLDLQGCANAACDRKPFDPSEYERLRQRLNDAGLGTFVADYLDRLHELERRRLLGGGDARRFDDVRAYREAIARLSLTTAAALAWHAGRGDAPVAIEGDADVDTLFRILMQCQIIDDVADYRADRRAGLPSFLTACSPLADAMALTAGTARAYATRDAAGGRSIFPLRVALAVSTTLALVALRVAHAVIPTSAGVIPPPAERSTSSAGTR